MENPRDVTKCFGCRYDQETYTYVQTKTGKSITHNTHGNRKVKASQVEIDDVYSGEPLTTARKAYFRLVSHGWTPMTRDDFPVGYPIPDASLKPSRLKDFFCRIFNLTQWHDVSSHAEIHGPKVSENGMVR